MSPRRSFFEFRNCPPAEHGYSSALAVSGGVLLLSVLFLSLLSPDRRPAAPVLRLLWGQLPLAVLCPAAALLVLRLSNRDISFRQLLDLRGCSLRQTRRLCLRNLKILLLAFPVIQLLILLTVKTLNLLGYHDLPQQQLFTPAYLESWAYCIVLFLCTVFLAPMAEEFLFRHLISNAFLCFFPAPMPQLLTSAAFALFHGIPQAIPALFFLALLLQKRKEEDGLWAAMLLHGLYNLIIFLFLAGRIFLQGARP